MGVGLFQTGFLFYRAPPRCPPISPLYTLRLLPFCPVGTYVSLVSLPQSHRSSLLLRRDLRDRLALGRTVQQHRPRDLHSPYFVLSLLEHGNNLIVKPIQTPTMLLPAILLAVLLLVAQAQDANIVVLTETVIQFCVIKPPLLI